MRNRTELVTTTLPGSENEEEASDLEDSEEDWKPSEKKKGAAPAGKVAKTSPKTPAKRKSASSSASKGKGKPSAKKAKKEESEDEDEDFDEEEDEDEMDDEEDEDDDGGDSKEDKKKKNGTSSPSKGGAKGKGGMANNKSFPDKDGKFELFLFKNDLVKDFRNDPKLCMWRRDGSSLLQKYIKVKDEENKDDVFFTSSSVYSCWEEKRKNDFFQIKVQCVGDKKDGKVKVMDVEELAKFAAEDRPQVEPKPTNPGPVDNGEEEEDGGEDEEDEDEEDEDVEEEE